MSQRGSTLLAPPHVAGRSQELVNSKGSDGLTSLDQPEQMFFRVIDEFGSNTIYIVSVSSDPADSRPFDDRFNLALSANLFEDSTSAKIRQLAALRAGWLDGEGEPFPEGAENWLLKNFVPLPFRVRPGLSPTPEGEFRAEWSVDDWEASAQINLHDRTVWWHALNIGDMRQEQNEEFKLVSDQDWQRLCSLANALITS